MKKKEWWKGKDVIKITANHWRTLLMGIKIGRLIGFKLFDITYLKDKNGI